MQRVKPDPIPTIHPVPENQVQGALLDMYTRTKLGFGVPWMGVVAMCFAHYPTFYGRLWAALEPIAQDPAFLAACTALRREAEAQAAQLGPKPITGWLRDAGYGTAEIEDIRTVNDVFSVGNMPYLLMATLARQLLEGQDWTPSGDVSDAHPVDASPALALPRPVLIEPHHGTDDVVALYADIRATLGLPFVNTDYRAFARWPSYFTQAWADLRPMVPTDGYSDAVGHVHAAAVRLASELPNPMGITPGDLISAADQDASHGEVLSVVRLFQWLLPGLATNVAFFRSQLNQVEPSAP